MNKGRTEQIIKVLKSGGKTLNELSETTGLSKENIYVYIRKLLANGTAAMDEERRFNEITGRMNEVYRLTKVSEEPKTPERPKVVNGKQVLVFLNDEDYNYLINRSKATKSENFRKIILDSKRLNQSI